MVRFPQVDRYLLNRVELHCPFIHQGVNQSDLRAGRIKVRMVIVTASGINARLHPSVTSPPSKGEQETEAIPNKLEFKLDFGFGKCDRFIRVPHPVAVLI